MEIENSKDQSILKHKKKVNFHKKDDGAGKRRYTDGNQQSGRSYLRNSPLRKDSSIFIPWRGGVLTLKY